MTIGDKLKALLIKRDMNQKELSEAADVSQAVISDLVNNKTTNSYTDTVIRIANVLGVAPSYFLDNPIGPIRPKPKLVAYLEFATTLAELGVTAEEVHAIVKFIRMTRVGSIRHPAQASQGPANAV